MKRAKLQWLTQVINLAFVISLLGAGLAILPAQGRLSASEEEIKAAFIFRFAQYTKWPSLQQDAFNICVYGRSNTSVSLNRYIGKKIQGRPLKVTHYDSAMLDNSCEVVFVASQRSTLRELLTERRYRPVLFISDIPGGFDEKIDIALITEPNKISFSINVTNAKKLGLSFSGQMLKLANKII